MTRLLNLLLDQLRTIVCAAGLLLLAGGCAMVYPPLGLIVPGAVLAALPVLGAMSTNPKGGAK